MMPGNLPELISLAGANGAGYAQELHPVRHAPPAPFEVRYEGGRAGYASTRLCLATKRNMHQPA